MDRLFSRHVSLRQVKALDFIDFERWGTYCFLHIIVDVAASGGVDVCRCEFCLC